MPSPVCEARRERERRRVLRLAALASATTVDEVSEVARGLTAAALAGKLPDIIDVDGHPLAVVRCGDYVYLFGDRGTHVVREGADAVLSGLL